MSNDIISIELIDALLSPPTSSSPSSSNSNAESIYKSIPVPTRIKSLLTILQSLLTSNNDMNNDDTTSDHNMIPRCMLISVLLRREVSSLGGYSVKNVKLTSEWEVVRLLGEMVTPLLNIFNHCGAVTRNGSNSNSSSTGPSTTGRKEGKLLSTSKLGIQRQIGFILAEVCATLSVMEDSISIDVMNVVIDQISDGCINANKECLQLFASLAQQSPLSLIQAKGKYLPHLLQNAIQTLQKSTQIILSAVSPSSSSSTSQQSRHEDLKQNQLQILLQHYHILLQTLNYVGIASDIEYPQSLSEHPKERMVQLIQVMANTTMMMTNTTATVYQKGGFSTAAAAGGGGSDPTKLTIKPNSNSANLAKTCLSTILKNILHIVNSSNAHSNNTQETIQEIMQSISQIASTWPTILAADYHLLSIVCKSLITIGEKRDLEPMVRLAACEALVTLCMVPDVRNVMMTEQMTLKNLCLVGKEGGHIQNGRVGGIIGTCTELLIHGVDTDVNDWAVEDIALQDEMQWDNDDISNFAEMILYSFLQNGGGGGAQALPTVLTIVETLLQSTEWQELRAGLILIDACLISSPHSFAPHIPIAVEAALNFSVHECVRVQFQAIELLGSLCQHDNMAEGESHTMCIRHEYGKRILQSFAHLLMSNCSKIVSHACLGIVSFCRGGNGKENAGIPIDKLIVLPYIGDLLNAIATGPLTKDINTNVVVYIRAFASIACLADVVGTDFSPYYSMVIKGLMDCVSFGLYSDSDEIVKSSGQVSHESISLRGAAIEAATIVGQSIGEEDTRFHEEATKIMNMVVPLLSQKSNFIPQDQLLSAAARISSIIGPAYNPYVPSVLPFLLEIAKEETNVSITDGNPESSGEDGDYDEDEGLQSITVSLPGMGAKKLTLNTSQIQEKILAARAVYEHASAMGANFEPYINACLEAFEPLLQFKYSAEVRATSAQALHPIFDAVFECLEKNISNGHMNSVATSYPRVLLTLSTQLTLEETDDIETMIAISDALSNICYSAFSHKKQDGTYFVHLSQAQAEQLTATLLNVIETCLDRRSNILASMTRYVDEDQQAELQELLAVESEFLTNVVDSIGYNLKCLKEKYLPTFEKYIEPSFGPLLTLTGTSDPRARFGAICLFCDCVEHCGSVGAVRYAAQLAEGCVQGLDDSTNSGDIGLKEVSVYGIAQIARHAPRSTLHASVGNIALRLLSIAKEAENMEKDDIEDLRLVENAASALATLSLFEKSPFQYVDGIQPSYILNAFLTNLPITMDEDEAKYCHQGLCELVEKDQIQLHGNVHLLVSVIGQIAAAVDDGEDVATQDTWRRLVEILGSLQQKVPADFQQAYSRLSSESQNAINALFRS